MNDMNSYIQYAFDMANTKPKELPKGPSLTPEHIPYKEPGLKRTGAGLTGPQQSIGTESPMKTSKVSSPYLVGGPYVGPYAPPVVPPGSTTNIPERNPATFMPKRGPMDPSKPAQAEDVVASYCDSLKPTEKATAQRSKGQFIGPVAGAVVGAAAKAVGSSFDGMSPRGDAQGGGTMVPAQPPTPGEVQAFAEPIEEKKAPKTEGDQKKQKIKESMGNLRTAKKKSLKGLGAFLQKVDDFTKILGEIGDDIGEALGGGGRYEADSTAKVDEMISSGIAVDQSDEKTGKTKDRLEDFRAEMFDADRDPAGKFAKSKGAKDGEEKEEEDTRTPWQKAKLRKPGSEGDVSKTRTPMMRMPH